MKLTLNAALVAVAAPLAFSRLLLGDCGPDCDCMVDPECAITWEVLTPMMNDRKPNDQAISTTGNKPKTYSGNVFARLQKKNAQGQWDDVTDEQVTAGGGITWTGSIPVPAGGSFSTGTYRVQVLNALLQVKKSGGEFEIYDPNEMPPPP